MKCENTGKLIIDKLAGELSPRQAAKLDRHLAACDACRREFEELSEIWQLTGATLKADSFAGKLAPAKRAEIFAAAQNEEKRRRTSMFTTRILEYAAVLLICIILAGMLLPTLSVSRGKARGISAGVTNTLGTPAIKLAKAEEADEKRQKTGKDYFARKPKAPARKDMLKPNRTITVYSPAHKNEKIRLVQSNWSCSPDIVTADAKKSRITSARMGGYADAESNLQPAKETLVKQKAASEGAYGNMLAIKPQAPQIQRSEAVLTLDEDDAAPVSAGKSITTYPVVTSDSPVESKPMRLKRKITKGSGSYLRLISDDKESLSQKSFKLDLKLWNMTTVPGVLKYLKAHNYPEPNNLRIYKAKNIIVIWATPGKLKKIENLFQKLREEEKKLNDLRDGLPFIKCSSRPVSTFSIDTDTASYVQARKSINRGERPDPLKIRPEEFINYFDYNYRSPHNATFAVYPEAAPLAFPPGQYPVQDRGSG